ncbi:hypothetical protein HDZ31DRAFT_37343 [Schizophyllum fasciatum]
MPPASFVAPSAPRRRRGLCYAFKSFLRRGKRACVCPAGPSAPSAFAPQPPSAFPPPEPSASVPQTPVPRPAAPTAATRPTPERPAARERNVVETATKSVSFLNIYSRDMLPRLCEDRSGFQRDPHWRGADKELINVMMPVNLLDCWLILFNARELKDVTFWRILADDSWRTFPKVEVRKLESLVVRTNDAWLSNLLDSLKIRSLQCLDIYYSAGRGGVFVHDQTAYLSLFRRAERLAIRGKVHISPNNVGYSTRCSTFQGRLHECIRQRAPNSRWTCDIGDPRD